MFAKESSFESSTDGEEERRGEEAREMEAKTWRSYIELQEIKRHVLSKRHCQAIQPYLEMVVPPPVRPPTITKFLKPYVLKMHFTNRFVTAQVIHSPTATVASSASSQEKALRESLDTHRDVAAAAKIGKILGERLLLKNIPAVSVHLKREQKYHGKVKAVIDNVVEAGVKLL